MNTQPIDWPELPPLPRPLVERLRQGQEEHDLRRAAERVGEHLNSLPTPLARTDYRPRREPFNVSTALDRRNETRANRGELTWANLIESYAVRILMASDPEARREALAELAALAMLWHGKVEQ